jgi:hypothetical protein
MGLWAWLKVIARNRRTIFNLVKEGFTGRRDALTSTPARSSTSDSASSAD